MLREIRLYGYLGREFGRVHRFDVASTGEALRALMANFKGFEQALLRHAPGFKLWQGAARVGDAADVNLPVGEREIIRLAPAIAGAGGNGLGQILTAAVLIAAAVVGEVVFPGNPVSPYLFKAGVMMAIGGVIQMLSPQPEMQAGSNEEKKPSYVFNGAQNTSAQGACVPLGYGRLIVGSAVVSAGMSAQDIALTAGSTPTGGGGWNRAEETI